MSFGIFLVKGLPRQSLHSFETHNWHIFRRNPFLFPFTLLSIIIKFYFTNISTFKSGKTTFSGFKLTEPTSFLPARHCLLLTTGQNEMENMPKKYRSKKKTNTSSPAVYYAQNGSETVSQTLLFTRGDISGCHCMIDTSVETSEPIASRGGSPNPM